MRQWTDSTVSYEQFREALVNIFPRYQTGILLERGEDSGWKYNLVAGLGVRKSVTIGSSQTLAPLNEFVQHSNDYTFGHFGYNLKRLTENAATPLASEDGFSDAFFFIPELVLVVTGSELRIGYFDVAAVADFHDTIGSVHSQTPCQPNDFALRTAEKVYIQNAGNILSHIHRGDIYEMNYCVEFRSENCVIDPAKVYGQLHHLTDAPYGGMYRNGNAWLFCGSPELYLRKTGTKLISQPIKGTRKRSADKSADDVLRDELKNDPKERSENVMIVDLVRNDLSKVAIAGSVCVEELFEITSHKTVHQMSSTIACEVDNTVSLIDIIKATFPMGSMTGAPKISAMEIAGRFEDQARGIYSGSIGYIEPNGDFEFNVVIRSIMWNAENKIASIKAGSALTAKCDPEREFEECLLKAEAMISAVKSV